MAVSRQAGPAWSDDDILEIARWQRHVIWFVLANLAVSGLLALAATLSDAQHPSSARDLISYLSVVAGIGFIVFSVYFTYNVARSVRERAAILYAFAVLIPLFNVLVLLALNNMATGVLRGNGVRVGLLGANPADLAAKTAAARPVPGVDKLRVAAIVVIVGFLLTIALMTAGLMSERGVPSTTRALDATDSRGGAPAAPRPPTTYRHIHVHRPAAAPPVGSNQAASQSPEPVAQPAKPVLGADSTFTVGQKTVVRTNSPRTKYAAVFEDDGETGYFYGLDRENTQSPVLDSLLIYDVSDVTDRSAPCRVQILWSADGMQAGLFINRAAYAVFDFQASRGYCRSGLPAPNPSFTRCSHAWSDDALRFFSGK